MKLTMTDPRLKAAFDRARAIYPTGALKAIYASAESVSEDDDEVPFVIIRRLQAEDWEAIGVMQQANEVAQEAAFKAKQAFKPPHKIGVEGAILATVVCEGADNPRELFKEFCLFAPRVYEAAQEFSGAGNPTVVGLPRNRS